VTRVIINLSSPTGRVVQRGRGRPKWEPVDFVLAPPHEHRDQRRDSMLAWGTPLAAYAGRNRQSLTRGPLQPRGVHAASQLSELRWPCPCQEVVGSTKRGAEWPGCGPADSKALRWYKLPCQPWTSARVVRGNFGKGGCTSTVFSRHNGSRRSTLRAWDVILLETREG
jgi:hypothetical protein